MVSRILSGMRKEADSPKDSKISCRNSWMYPEFHWFPLISIDFHRFPLSLNSSFSSYKDNAASFSKLWNQARAIWPSTFRMRDMWSRPCRSDSSCDVCDGNVSECLLWWQLQDIQMRTACAKWIKVDQSESDSFDVGNTDLFEFWEATSFVLNHAAPWIKDGEWPAT